MRDITQAEHDALIAVDNLLTEVVHKVSCPDCPLNDLCEDSLCEKTLAAIDTLSESCKVEQEQEECVEDDWVKDREEPYD